MTNPQAPIIKFPEEFAVLLELAVTVVKERHNHASLDIKCDHLLEDCIAYVEHNEEYKAASAAFKAAQSERATAFKAMQAAQVTYNNLLSDMIDFYFQASKTVQREKKQGWFAEFMKAHKSWSDLIDVYATNLTRCPQVVRLALDT